MATSPHYLYPWPQDDVLVFHDVGRCWIGKTERFGQIEYHLNWMIDDREGREINHRLTFKSEAVLRKTLYNGFAARSEEHTSELQSLMRISYAVFGLKKKREDIIARNQCRTPVNK